jgi:hypothetical protein
MAEEAFMRGPDEQTGSMFSYIDLEERILARHPLRKIREFVNVALTALTADFARLYSADGRPSIAPERLLRAALLQILFSIRSERQLMEQMEYNLLFRWFVGLEPFGWSKTVGLAAKTMLRGLERVDGQFIFNLAAHNLVRLPKLLAA